MYMTKLSQMTSPRIKLVAIAKNEGYNLPHWVFHHFFLGVDSIDIYLNRTSDNSSQVLDKLKTKFSNLNYYYSDWVDKISYAKEPVHMQGAVYTYAYLNTVQDHDYMMVLDLDEYLIFRNSITLKGLLEELKFPDVLTFEWFCVNGRERHSCQPLASESHNGFLAPLGKSIYKSGLLPDKITAHIPFFYDATRYLLADGGEFQHHPQQREWINPALQTELKEAFIFHDHMRSPIYHLSGILGGRSGRLTNGMNPLKLTKSHYNRERKSCLSFNLALQLPEAYQNAFQQMFRELELEEDMAEAYKLRILMALEVWRQLSLNQNPALLETIIASVGNLASIKAAIFSEFRRLGDPRANLESFNFLTANHILLAGTGDTEQAFQSAVALFPFAADEYNEPHFLKEYLRWLLGRGEFEKALALVDDETILANRTFPRTWHQILFGRAYEKLGKKQEARNWYEKLRFTYKPEVNSALERLKIN